MKKRTVLFVMVCCLALCFSSCSDAPNGEISLQESNATLIVCGKEVVGDHHIRIDYDKRDMEIPLIVAAQAMGATIDRRSSHIVDLIFEDTTYRLNLKRATLIDQNVNRGNLLTISPGATSPGLAVVTEDDVIVDLTMSIHFLLLREMKVDIDYDNAVIYIEKNPA